MQTLRDKTVVITGAASGIGRALAIQAAAEGARLALSDVDTEGLAVTATRCGPGCAVRTDRLDVAERSAWAGYADAVAADLGAADVIVNNAGVALSSDIADMSYEDLEWLMSINFWGVVHGTKAFLPQIVASGDGHVVNISSLFGILSVPSQSAYNAAKFAVRGFTESLRTEMLAARLPVGVTCVHPGGIRTAIARNGRGDARHDAAAIAAHFDEKLAKTSAEKAAQGIWRGVRRGKARVLVGPDAKVLDVLVRLTGAGYQRVVARTAGRAGPPVRWIERAPREVRS
ncbi:SDR family NAD(P)-dependent oxidoreductase [Cumulibacter manganitolerans]|uniref:SDR family NAD(P)-dependent oxidoreductase n=1 Tax=Cumulibacter manganitolerans TaxID=1884992 RepID=UPI001294A5BE|nr:SDR family NAD(P)-dependent oxidoreductase [Cumulibacter manganitolerans]